MWRALLLAVVLAVVPSEAWAVTLVTPDGQVAQPYQRIADRSKVPTPDARITLLQTVPDCPGDFGCAPKGTIEVDRSAGIDPHIFLHELGHQFDFFVLTDADRAVFRWVLHDARGWDGETRSAQSLREQFADLYALCAEYGPRPRPVWDADPRDWGVSLPQYRRVCALIRHAGGWYMRPSAA